MWELLLAQEMSLHLRASPGFWCQHQNTSLFLIRSSVHINLNLALNKKVADDNMKVFGKGKDERGKEKIEKP
jgi:hypothetical protein